LTNAIVTIWIFLYNKSINNIIKINKLNTKVYYRLIIFNSNTTLLYKSCVCYRLRQYMKRAFSANNVIMRSNISSYLNREDGNKPLICRFQTYFVSKRFTIKCQSTTIFLLLSELETDNQQWEQTNTNIVIRLINQQRKIV